MDKFYSFFLIDNYTVKIIHSYFIILLCNKSKEETNYFLEPLQMSVALIEIQSIFAPRKMQMQCD